MQQIALLVSTAVDVNRERLTLNDLAPRSEYTLLSRSAGVDVVDYARVFADRHPEVHRIRGLLGPALAQAYWAYLNRCHYDLIYCDSERVGIPLAALLKARRARIAHLIIARWLFPLKKAMPLRLLRLHSHVDRVVCHTTAQFNASLRAGLPQHKLRLVPYGIDHHFWRPFPPVDTAAPQRIVSAGVEQRDYQTFFGALRDTGIDTTIAAASPLRLGHSWRLGRELPSGVRVSKLTHAQLRLAYAASSFVVVPLLDRDLQSGITVILEAMAMGKAVVVSETRGIAGTGIIRPGQNGLFVPPGDVAALREAMLYLALNPDEARRMGAAGRQTVENGFTLDHFVSQLRQIIQELISPGRATATDVRARTSERSQIGGAK